MKQKSVMKDPLASCTTKEEVMAASLRVQQEMSDKVAALINSYHAADWPILAAVMKIDTEALVSHLEPVQHLLYEITVSMTGTVSAKVKVDSHE